LIDRDYLKIKQRLEVVNYGTTQSRKAKEGQAEPQAARILQQDRIIQGKVIILPINPQEMVTP